MKKGFSLAELMVALAVMSVISAILVPALMDIVPNNEKYLFKSAHKTVETAVSELINDNALYPSGDFSNPAVGVNFCEEFSKLVNIVGSVNCTLTNEPGPDTTVGDTNEPNFVTTNGMKWWGLNSSFATDYADPTGGDVQIFVDVNGDNGNGALNDDIYRIQVEKNGKIVVNDEDIDAIAECGSLNPDANSNSNAVDYLRTNSVD